MTKLDGNNRWATKFILPEHREQYEMRNTPQLTGPPTMDELVMIRDYIVFPHIVQMIQKSREDMSIAQISLKGLIIRCLDIIMQRVTNDFYTLKRELKMKTIKVIEEETNDGILYYRYYCRGYDEKFGIARETLRSQIIDMMTKYTNEIGSQLKN